MADFGRAAIPAATSYENGGWADGRLGQAYDLIAAVLRDHAEGTAELRLDLQKSLNLVEMTDQFLERLSKEEN